MTQQPPIPESPEATQPGPPPLTPGPIGYPSGPAPTAPAHKPTAPPPPPAPAPPDPANTPVAAFLGRYRKTAVALIVPLVLIAQHYLGGIHVPHLWYAVTVGELGALGVWAVPNTGP